MKNKEIEELLNDIKEQVTIDEKLGKEIAKDFHKTTLNYKEVKLLLSYIEQLEKENDRLKEVVENLTTMTVNGDTKQIKNTAQYKLEQLENNRDKAIEYIKQNATDENGDIGINFYASNTYELLNILKGDSDEFRNN